MKLKEKLNIDKINYVFLTYTFFYIVLGIIIGLLFHNEKIQFLSYMIFIPIFYSFYKYKTKWQFFWLFCLSFSIPSYAISDLTKYNFFIALLAIFIMGIQIYGSFLISYFLSKKNIYLIPLSFVFTEIIFFHLPLSNIVSSHKYIIQLASIFGSTGITVFIIFINVLLTDFLLKRKKVLFKINLLKIIIFTLVVFFVILYGYFHINYYINEKDSKNQFSIQTLQPFVQTQNKGISGYKNEWLMYKKIIQKHNTPSDLIVFPETAINFKNEKKINEINDFLLNKLRTIDSDFIIGTLSYDEKNKKTINSAYVYSNDEKKYIGQYIKQKPVPIGEYAPENKLIKKIVLDSSFSKIIKDNFYLLYTRYNYGDYYKIGKENKTYNSKAANYVIGICFDDYLKNNWRKKINNKNGNIIVSISNNHLLSESPKTNRVYKDIRKIIGVSLGKYYIINDNYGYSYIINPFGKFIKKNKLNENQINTTNVNLINKKNIYLKYGYLFKKIIILIIMCFIFLSILKFPIIRK